ncbi:hypothetical protein [Pseudoalteromonas sp. Of7M-16]|uniref:hypothetical protein n=1 Tax=Pseudoalteromonas sp. Of7M-16 TaxID=2917756 RepID=UPI001EF4BEA4|nr:hypothetical protein [Pseudoalteromonas sp. Of7M-16]MCG7551174.1 hypothetical protein [Pseudoalteromonas sp. Of7M-16]
MSKLKRALYIFEFVVGFAPSILLLTLGLIFSPAILLGLFAGQPLSILVFFLVAGGLIGFWGAISLLGLTLYPEQENTHPTKLKIYLVLGALSSVVASYSVSVINIYLLPFTVTPLFVTLHLAFIQRHHLNGSTIA